MGNFSITNEKKTGDFKYESGLYVITGSCIFSLDTNEFKSANGQIWKEEVNIGYFNTYGNSVNPDNTNINIPTSYLVEVAPIIVDCLTAIGDYYTE
jgi:hypothetical protein